MKKFYEFCKAEEGITAIEYGIMAALMAVALVTAVGLVTGGLNTAFTNIKNTMTAAG
jgi:pilus assembly protein Flp/PilA